MKYDALFSPIKLRGLELKNRVIMPSMNTKMAHEVITEQALAYYAARAKGGCGLIVFEATAIHPTGHTPFYAGLYTDRHRDEMKKLTSAVHEAGGKVAIQLLHPGLVCEPFMPEGTRVMSPKTMNEADIKEMQAAFGRSARLAVEAGFDTIEFHAAHSYLVHEFLSAAINKRDDEYNGDIKARAKFALGCIRAIRENIPEEMPLIMRVNAKDDFLKDGLTIEDTVQFINMAAEAGVDVASVSRGNAMGMGTIFEVPPVNLRQGCYIDLTAQIKKAVDIPVVVVGRINDPEMANQVVADGKADLVAVGRAQIADPEWCGKAQRGEDERIVRCIGCMQGCFDSVLNARRESITCLRNPMVSREHETVSRTETPKRVMVVGGGMGGMYTARLLQERGHVPSLYEATDKLGGEFFIAGSAPGKEEFREAVLWEARETARVGVDIHLQTEVTPELIEQVRPDEVVVASGSVPIASKVAGAHRDNVLNCRDVLSGKCVPLGRVVIIGGGSIGLEAAEYLAAKGAECSVLTRRQSLEDTHRQVGMGPGALRKMMVRSELKKLGVHIIYSASAREIGSGFVVYHQDGELQVIPCDAVIIASGVRSRDTSALTQKCEQLGIPYHVIGDAVNVRDALHAVVEGADVALKI